MWSNETLLPTRYVDGLYRTVVGACPASARAGRRRGGRRPARHALQVGAPSPSRPRAPYLKETRRLDRLLEQLTGPGERGGNLGFAEPRSRPRMAIVPQSIRADGGASPHEAFSLRREVRSPSKRAAESRWTTAPPMVGFECRDGHERFAVTEANHVARDRVVICMNVTYQGRLAVLLDLSGGR